MRCILECQESEKFINMDDVRKIVAEDSPDSVENTGFLFLYYKSPDIVRREVAGRFDSYDIAKKAAEFVAYCFARGATVIEVPPVDWNGDLLKASEEFVEVPRGEYIFSDAWGQK